MLTNTSQSSKRYAVRPNHHQCGSPTYVFRYGQLIWFSQFISKWGFTSKRVTAVDQFCPKSYCSTVSGAMPVSKYLEFSPERFPISVQFGAVLWRVVPSPNSVLFSDKWFPTCAQTRTVPLGAVPYPCPNSCSFMVSAYLSQFAQFCDVVPYP